MIKLHGVIQEEFIEAIEDNLYELAPHNWIILYYHDENIYKLEGYFKDEMVAESELHSLSKKVNFEFLPSFELTEIQNENWKNSYKKHFIPWSIDHFHWVPIWCKNKYKIPIEHTGLYLDPNMAFGTGNHETTQLCLESIISIGIKQPNQSFIDLGCGSGILALTASKLGYKSIYAIDNDESALKVSNENAKLNEIDNIKYVLSDVKDFVIKKKFHIVAANIQADILKMNSTTIANLVKPEGCLLLSGILAVESEDICKTYGDALNNKELNFSVKKVIRNEWCILRFDKI